MKLLFAILLITGTMMGQSNKQAIVATVPVMKNVYTCDPGWKLQSWEADRTVWTTMENGPPMSYHDVPGGVLEDINPRTSDLHTPRCVVGETKPTLMRQTTSCEYPELHTKAWNDWCRDHVKPPQPPPQFPASAIAQLILTPMQAAYPGNEHFKECGPKNQEMECVKYPPPESQWHDTPTGKINPYLPCNKNATRSDEGTIFADENGCITMAGRKRVHPPLMPSDESYVGDLDGAPVCSPDGTKNPCWRIPMNEPEQPAKECNLDDPNWVKSLCTIPLHRGIISPGEIEPDNVYAFSPKGSFKIPASDGSIMVKLSDDEHAKLQSLRQAVMDEEKRLAVQYGATLGCRTSGDEFCQAPGSKPFEGLTHYIAADHY